MIHCEGCGLFVLAVDAIRIDPDHPNFCDACTSCTRFPVTREAYRRGFNEGLDKLAQAVMDMVEKSNLRKMP